MAPGVSFCPWCGTAAVTHRSEETTLPCPDCAKATLQARTLPVPPGSTGRRLWLADCPRCHGLWVDRDTVDSLVASHADDTLLFSLVPGVAARAAPSRARVGSGTIRYRPCPECRSIMNRVNYARISGIVIDVCRDHGSWFDAHELPAVLEFVRRGGLDTARTRDAERLADERRRLERERMLGTRSALMAHDRQAGLAVSAFSARPETGAPGLFRLLGDLFRDGRLR